jgi:hypothetical protein
MAGKGGKDISWVSDVIEINCLRYLRWGGDGEAVQLGK